MITSLTDVVHGQHEPRAAQDAQARRVRDAHALVAAQPGDLGRRVAVFAVAVAVGVTR
jgi:hypothetical protein